MYFVLKNFWCRKRKCQTLIPSWFLCSFFQIQQNVECVYTTSLIKLSCSTTDELTGVKFLSRFLSRLLYAKQQYATIYIENWLYTFLHLKEKYFQSMTKNNILKYVYTYICIYAKMYAHHTLYILQIYIYTLYISIIMWKFLHQSHPSLEKKVRKKQVMMQILLTTLFTSWIKLTTTLSALNINTFSESGAWI